MNEAGASAPKGLDYTLGGMDARIVALEKRVAMVEREIKEELRALNDKNDRMNQKIDALNDAIIASRSSWKTIGWFVGIIAALSTAAMTLHQIGLIH